VCFTLVRLCIQQDACFSQLPKLFFNVQQNALFNVAFRCCLLVCRSLEFRDAMLLVPPIERLPLKQESDSAGVLWKEIDVLESEVANLKTQIRNVFRMLAAHI